MQSVTNILLMFLGIFFLLFVLQYFLGNVQEAFTFCRPDDCSCVCERNEYKAYCNSPYLADGPAGLCKCNWNQSTNTCQGTRASNTKCQP